MYVCVHMSQFVMCWFMYLSFHSLPVNLCVIIRTRDHIYVYVCAYTWYLYLWWQFGRAEIP